MTLTDPNGVMPGIVLLTAGLVFVVGWAAARAWYRANNDYDSQLLDSVWELCDAMGWPGDLGTRLYRVLELEPGEPLPDAIDDPEAEPEPALVPSVPRTDYDEQWAEQGRVPVVPEATQEAVDEYMSMADDLPADDESPGEVALQPPMPVTKGDVIFSGTWPHTIAIPKPRVKGSG